MKNDLPPTVRVAAFEMMSRHGQEPCWQCGTVYHHASDGTGCCCDHGGVMNCPACGAPKDPPLNREVSR